MIKMMCNIMQKMIVVVFFLLAISSGMIFAMDEDGPRRRVVRVSANVGIALNRVFVEGLRERYGNVTLFLKTLDNARETCKQHRNNVDPRLDSLEQWRQESGLSVLKDGNRQHQKVIDSMKSQRVWERGVLAVLVFFIVGKEATGAVKKHRKRGTDCHHCACRSENTEDRNVRQHELSDTQDTVTKE